MARPKGASQLFTEKQVGGSLRLEEENPILGAGTTAVVGSDPERTQILIINLSGGEVIVGFTNQVASDNGIILPANGGFFSMIVSDDFELVGLPVFMSSAAGGNQIYIMTARRETRTSEE